MFSTRPWRWLAALAVLLFIGPKVVLMFPAWLMGVVVYHICKAKALPAAAGWALTIGSLVLFTAYQFAPLPIVQQFYNSNDFVRFISLAQHYFIAMLFAANLVGFSIVSVSFAQILERHAQAIRWVAGSTFSIYLAHLPIMHLLTVSSPWPRGSILTVVLLLAATPILCLIFAELSERRKELWRRSLDAVLPRLPYLSLNNRP